MIGLRRGLVAALAGALLVAPGAPARAESSAPGAQARLHVDAAQSAFDAGRYEEAIREFRAAYDLVPEPRLSYNIGVCFERLERREDAIEHFERYLREEPEASDREAVRERISRLHRERAEAQDAPLDVEAADDQSLAERVDAIERAPLESAHHDIGLVVGSDVCLNGLRTCDEDVPASFGLLLDYHYRFDPAWHIGAGFVGDWSGASGGNRQSHYGVLAGVRYAFHPIPVLEVRLQGHVGYQYVDLHERAIGYGSAHWIFFRLGPSVAWDLYRGFGLRFDLAARLGYVDYAEVDDTFGAGLDVHLGIFWAL